MSDLTLPQSSLVALHHPNDLGVNNMINMISKISRLSDVFSLTLLFSLLASQAISKQYRLTSDDWAIGSNPYSHQFSSEVKRLGKKSQRFEVRNGDCKSKNIENDWDCKRDRERSEIVTRPLFALTPGIWFGYSIYIPNDFNSSDVVTTTIGQIHRKGGPKMTDKYGMEEWPNLLAFTVKGNVLSLALSNLRIKGQEVVEELSNHSVGSLSSLRGKWTDVAFHIQSRNGIGIFELFIDQKKILQLPQHEAVYAKGYFFKYGIYRHYVSKAKRGLKTQVLFIDEVKAGDTLIDVSPNPQKPVD